MPVNKCICTQRSFEEIKEIAKNQKLTTVKELQSAGISSTGCQLCTPYIEKMLVTGQTSFIAGSVYKKKS